MKILAVDFSSDRRSVAIVVDGRTLGVASEAGGRNTHALGLIERALSEAGIEREAIETIAVGLGPGSYAGIRAAIAMAQGWQLARGVRLLGIGTVECLAAQAQAAGVLGLVLVVIDAQRGEFYLASYEISPDQTRVTRPLRLATEQEVRKYAATGQMLIGAELLSVFPGGHIMHPDAVRLGQIAEGRTDFVPGDKLEPVYLREVNFVKAPPPRLISNP